MSVIESHLWLPPRIHHSEQRHWALQHINYARGGIKTRRKVPCTVCILSATDNLGMIRELCNNNAPVFGSGTIYSRSQKRLFQCFENRLHQLVFRIRIHLFQIRHFRLNTDPDPIRIQGFDDRKIGRKKILAEKFLNNFFDHTQTYNCNLSIPRPP